MPNHYAPNPKRQLQTVLVLVSRLDNGEDDDGQVTYGHNVLMVSREHNPSNPVSKLCRTPSERKV